MPDQSFLSWPFFDKSHGEFAASLDRWASANVAALAPDSEVHGPALDDVCRRLVRALGNAGFLRVCVPATGGSSERLDVRTICIAREILARHDGLADFAFAMQGLGSGGISLFGTPEQQRRYLPAVC